MSRQWKLPDGRVVDGGGLWAAIGGDPETAPTTCANCGGPSFNGTVCDNECHDAMVASLFRVDRYDDQEW